MNLIDSIQLTNRILITETENNPEKIREIFALCDKYKLAALIGNDGAYVDGPYINALYVKRKQVVQVEDFLLFGKELIDYLDMYQGVMPFTYFEMDLTYTIDGKQLPAQLVTYYDIITEKPVSRALELGDPPVHKLKPRHQMRLTKESLSSTRKEYFIFNPVFTNNGGIADGVNDAVQSASIGADTQ